MDWRKEAQWAPPGGRGRGKGDTGQVSPEACFLIRQVMLPTRSLFTCALSEYVFCTYSCIRHCPRHQGGISVHRCRIESQRQSLG